jgi:hypothetical protein
MDSKYRVIVENWNKFINEDLETDGAGAQVYLVRLQKIFNKLRKLADKPMPRGDLGFKKRGMRGDIPVDPGKGWEAIKSKIFALKSGEPIDSLKPGQWIISKGKQIHNMVKGGISSGLARQLGSGADYADFEPRLTELADELIAIGDLDPTPEELEAQVYQLLPEIRSLSKMLFEITQKIEYPDRDE